MNSLRSGVIAALALAAAAAARADAPAHWTSLCASCHGKDGGGHTRAGRLVHVKDLTSADYQKTFTDAEAFSDVKTGRQKDGRTQMKPFASRLSDADIRELVSYVRSLAR